MAKGKTRKTPQYQKLYEILRRQIVDGVYEPGDLLPSENELKTANMLSQPTVRKAVELLQEEGFVKKRQGKGSIVLSRPVGVGIISFEGELFTSQHDNPKICTKITRNPQLVRVLPEIFGFQADGSEAEKGYYFFERRRSVDNQIIFHEQLCIPNDNLERFKQLKLDNVSLYETLFRRYYILTTASEQRFWAIRADVPIAGQLGVAAGDPVQRLQRRFTTNRPGFYIYSNLSANTGKIFLFSHST